MRPSPACLLGCLFLAAYAISASAGSPEGPGKVRRAVEERLRGGTSPTEALAWVIVEDEERCDVTKLLLDAGADPDTPLRNGMSPLTWAAMLGDACTARELLAAGADPDLRDATGWTAIMWATGRGPTGDAILRGPGAYTQVTAALIDAGASADRLTEVDLLQAIRRDEQAAALRLLERTDPNARDSSGTPALIWASYRQDITVVRALLERGADPNGRSANHTPLTAVITAATPADTARVLEIVKVLLAAGTDPNVLTSSGTALAIASDRDERGEMAQLLVSAGTTPDLCPDHGRTPLMTAASGGVVRTMDLLLRAGADVNAHDWRGWTPVFFAAAGDKEAATTLLLTAGADLRARAYDRRSALDVARAAGATSTTLLLEGCASWR